MMAVMDYIVNQVVERKEEDICILCRTPNVHFLHSFWLNQDNECDEGEKNLIPRRNYQRSSTDLHHLFMFVMFLMLWIGIAIYAYIVNYQSPEIVQETNSEFIGMMLQLQKCRFVCVSFIWLGILFLGLYFIAIRFFTKYVIYITIFLMLALLSLILIQFFRSKSYFQPILVSAVIVYLIFCSLTVYSFQQVGYKTICIIIQESCKAMVCHPSSILIVTIYFALIVLVNYFIAIVTLRILAISKYEINDSSKFIDPPKNVLFLLFTFIGCSCWIIAVIYNIQRVTLYGIFSTWYQTADKTKISCTISIKMMYTIFRYHFGTLTFGSTIFTIIPIIRIIFNSRTDLYRKFKANKNTIFCYLVILVNATSNTFVTCVSHGTGYYHSMQDSFKLLMQHPLKFVTIRIITELLIFFGAVLIPGLTLFFAYQYILPDTDTDGITIIVIATVLFSITFIFLQSFHAATTAVLHCFLEDLNFKTNESDCNENISVVNDDA